VPFLQPAGALTAALAEVSAARVLSAPGVSRVTQLSVQGSTSRVVRGAQQAAVEKGGLGAAIEGRGCGCEADAVQMRVSRVKVRGTSGENRTQAAAAGDGALSASSG
jgi:hypothetical protein